MSDIGNPEFMVHVILKNVEDPESISQVFVDDKSLGILLFTQQKFADDFLSAMPDKPNRAGVTHILAPDLADALRRQAETNGIEYVITDPILGTAKYLDQKTLPISEYIAMLATS